VRKGEETLGKGAVEVGEGVLYQDYCHLSKYLQHEDRSERVASYHIYTYIDLGGGPPPASLFCFKPIAWIIELQKSHKFPLRRAERLRRKS